MSFDDELALAKTAAREAGARLSQRSREDLTVSSSRGRDIKMAADRAAERIIVDVLGAGAHPILAEEGGDMGVRPGIPYWVVDPLDGTFNYHREIPHYCTSIGLWRDDTPILGVIYDVPNSALYSGVVDQGAWLDDRPVRVSGQTSADQSVLATGFPVGRAFDEASLGAFVADVQRFKKIRLFGSAAMSLAYVASGMVDAYAEDGINLWDIAAGVAIVKAAGGFVDVEVSGSSPWSRTVRTACNPALWTRP